MENDKPSLSDVSDLDLMFNFGYRNFMFGDTICQDKKAFNKAAEFLKGYVEWREK